jgi:hypothetical protein
MRKIAKATCVCGVLGAIFGGGALVLSACVDGTTPDCSSPDAGCGPSAVEADASDDGDADAATTTDSAASDTGTGGDVADAPSGDDADDAASADGAG